MPLITLTSDVGLKDYQIPLLKGYLHSQVPKLQLIDISHEIKPFDYLEAAHVLGNAFRYFPEGTVHLVGVEGDFDPKPQYVCIKVEGHIFLTKNTGFVSLISQEEPEWGYELQLNQATDLKLPMVHVLAKTAIALLNGAEPRSQGKLMESFPTRILQEPQLSPSTITGAVVFINRHLNVHTNIHRRHFKGFNHFNRCLINYTRNAYIDRISNSYYDVPEGDVACFFGHNGYLEFGIHGGNASRLLSLELGHNILVEFE